MRLPTLLIALACAAPAFGQAPGVTVTEAWSRTSTPGAQTGAIYVTVTAGQPDRLIAVATPAAAKVELHQTKMQDGVMQMRPVDGGLPVTPGTPIRMAPGGYHIMLMGLKQPLKQGDHVPMTLTFEHAGAVQAEAVVAAPGASAPPRR